MVIRFPSGNDTVILNTPSDQQILVIESWVTGMNPIDNDYTAISCFPNPAHDSFTILLGNSFLGEEKTIRLFNITGALLDEVKLAAGSNVLEWKKSLTAGMYVVEATIGNEKRQVKLVME